MTDRSLILRLITPAGQMTETKCDVVTLFARDNEEGEGGGSVGIMRGHASAVIALAAGQKITAKQNGAVVFSAVAPLGGLAHVKDDVVTVVTEKTE